MLSSDASCVSAPGQKAAISWAASFLGPTAVAARRLSGYGSVYMPSAAPMTFEEAQSLVRRDLALDDALARVRELDFTMLRMKLRKESGWTSEMCDEVEGLYRNFLALNLRYPGRKICPTGPIDEFWHAHILDTRAYAADCERLFGAVLHHYPYFGLRGPADEAALNAAFADTVDLFIRHFGVDPAGGDSRPRSCRPQNCP